MKQDIMSVLIDIIDENISEKIINEWGALDIIGAAEEHTKKYLFLLPVVRPLEFLRRTSMIKAEIITDSISLQNNRLTTFVITYPRIILAEFNTHRMLSRNSASCLHGDTEIFFDLPNAIKKNKNNYLK